jgi:hypothetical protein
MKQLLFSLGTLTILALTACTKQVVAPQTLSLTDALVGQWQGVSIEGNKEGLLTSQDMSDVIWEFSKDSLKIANFSNADTAYINDQSLITYTLNADTMTTAEVLNSKTREKIPTIATVGIKNYIVAINGQEMVLKFINEISTIEYKFKRASKKVVLISNPQPTIIGGTRT